MVVTLIVLQVKHFPYTLIIVMCAILDSLHVLLYMAIIELVYTHIATQKCLVASYAWIEIFYSSL